MVVVLVLILYLPALQTRSNPFLIQCIKLVLKIIKDLLGKEKDCIFADQFLETSSLKITSKIIKRKFFRKHLFGIKKVVHLHPLKQ